MAMTIRNPAGHSIQLKSSPELDGGPESTCQREPSAPFAMTTR
jgi:hypothetical protein